jgi:hypothetical protein
MEANGLRNATSVVNTVETKRRTSVRELKRSRTLTCGHVVVNTSHSRSQTKANDLTRNDLIPTRTAGRASRNDRALHMGALAKANRPPKEMSAEIRRAGIQSRT